MSTRRVGSVPGTPVVACAVPQYRFLVFNRWGQEIFLSTVPARDWDGQYGGVPSPDGVYAYIVEYKGPAGRLRRATGHVTLLR
jgi:gliding motility-associated-like protein